MSTHNKQILYIMEPKFIISEVFSTAWKGTKSQLWILAGLLIGYCILSFTLTAFAMPMQSSIIGKIIVNVISAYEYRFHPPVLHGSLLGGVRVLSLSVAPCVPGQRSYADALARLPVSCGDGIRDGSFAPLVCPQAHLAKRR